MRTIWKFPIPVGGGIIEMPSSAQILTVQLQRGEAMIWALTLADAPKKPRRVFVAGTGHPLPDELDASQYIGTFQLNDGILVFHVFDLGTP